MATEQPDWEFVVNLGDASPFDYGGYFVFKDKTGVYDAEAELLELDEPDNEDSTYTIYRVGLDRLKLKKGYLVPYKYTKDWTHPLSSYDAWFHDYLESVAETMGMGLDELEEDFTSADPVARAFAYRAVYDYHGWENGDSYPLHGLTREEVERRYPFVN